MHLTLKSICAQVSLVTLLMLSTSGCGGGGGAGADPQNRFVQENLVANSLEYGAKFTFPEFINAWGIAIRPAGAGGHFWVTAGDISHEFVGDVQNSMQQSLQMLTQDNLARVSVPVGGNGVSTGIVFNEGSKFVVTQTIPGRPVVSAPAKFIAVSDSGIISAWTERKNADGSFDRSGTFTPMVDRSNAGGQFFGVAMNPSFDRLYVADFGKSPGIKVFGPDYQELASPFPNPFDENANGKVDAGELAPWNVQALSYPSGQKSLFVAYVKTKRCPRDAQEEALCADGDLLPGEEDSLEGGEQGGHPDKGRVVEFSFNGELLSIWNDHGRLNAPWGVVFAPADFGSLSGKLLVGNFGGKGRIAAFDPATKEFEQFMKDAGGEPVAIPGLWGLIFGNGASLGDANALYFAAGPGDEADGLFGSLRYIK